MTQDEALAILKAGGNVFLTGEPGAGKTYTINSFRDWLRENGIEYAVTASTGIAASHIDGMTIHSWSGIGVKRKLSQHQIETMRMNEFVNRRIRGVRVLIIDEISMLDATTIDLVDYVMRELRFSQQPFGGCQVIFVGDFFQLPPVVKNEPLKFAFESWSWGKAKPRVCYLTEQHRQSDAVFLEILSAMRAGTITQRHVDILKGRMKADLPVVPTRLYTHNEDVDRINEFELDKVQGEKRTYTMRESGIPFMVDILKKACLSPEVLELKIGATVMFTRNNFEEGYVNGTIGTLVEYDEESGLPIVEDKNGDRYRPVRAEWHIEENGLVKATIEQVPLRLAWAITVHKSQGMSLDSAAIDLSRTFEFGQGYVAISRVRSLEGLRLEGINEKAFKMHPRVVDQDKIFRA